MKSALYTILMVSFSALIGKAQSNGQSQDLKDITRTILHLDTLFWQAYNACDVDMMATFLTDDLELYHDKGGFTASKALFVESIRKGLCGNPEWRLRREAIEGTVNVFPMDNYGAIITGEHIFYIQETDKKEYLDGYGKFMQLWQFKNNQWKMSRVFSYDHGPAPYINKRKEIAVAVDLLKTYAGKYESPQVGVITVTPDGNSLKLDGNNLQSVIFPESENLFFIRERDLQFEFVSERDEVVKMIVYEKGSKVEEAKRIP